MVLQALVQAMPATLRKRDRHGFLPLHHICCSEYTLLVNVQFLVYVWPGTLQLPNAEGKLPLHLACKNQLPTDVIRCLVKSYAYAVSVQDKKGQLPLHIACRKRLDVQVIESLVRVCPGSVSVWKDDQYPVVRYGLQRYYDEENASLDMPKRRDADDHSQAVSVQAQEDDDDDEDDETSVVCYDDRRSWRRLALDMVCDTSTSKQSLTMEYVLVLTNGIPPLHFSCSQRSCTIWYPHRKQTLEKLAALSATPDEDWMRFHQGMLPFHCACRAQADKNMLLWLGEKYPDALRTRTTDTLDSPLHCYLSFWEAVLNTTANATPYNEYMASQSSYWPVYSFSTVRYLVKQYPAALNMANRLGWLPIHLAAMHNAPLTILFYLARRNPESLLQGNP